MSGQLGEESMNTILYHGTTERIEHPLCHVGRPNLDFGQGFYLTELRAQAIDWAERMSLRRGEPALLNLYKTDIESLQAEARCRIFEAYDEQWLSFIVACRQGYDPRKDYDMIIGGVANDRVIDTVRLYMQGLMPMEIALKRLAEHQPNNQICMLNQSLTDKYLIFDGTERIE